MDALRLATLRGSRLGRCRGESHRRRPIIVANPRDDGAFRALIDIVLLSDGLEACDVEAVLRTRYPEAIVRPRELAGELVDVWYVYRDGHWIRSDANDGA
jgi:hypothetical protein